MEVALQGIDVAPASLLVVSAKATMISSSSCEALSAALQAALPLLREYDDSNNSNTTKSSTATGPQQQQQQTSQQASQGQDRSLQNNDSASSHIITAAWLKEQLAAVPSELGTDYLAQQVWEASQLHDEASQQAALFDALGASEEAMMVLFEITPHLASIQSSICQEELLNGNSNNHPNKNGSGTTPDVFVDLEEERRQLLLHQALEAAQEAAIAQAQVEALHGRPSSSSGAAVTATHTIARTSDKRAIKLAQKAKKRAEQAMQRAREAGAILDPNDDDDGNNKGQSLLQQQMQDLSVGQGGLMGRTRDEVLALQQSLLPQGSRHYYDDRGLPFGTVQEEGDGYVKTIIPPAPRDERKLHERLRIEDVLNPIEQEAFRGTTSLNPMQSSVFQMAFRHRENLLVCAPTGAGKTNVAMLTVVAHFRDVGLLGTGVKIDTGRKVVYIAPMKALAQEVVEKFSSKLKSLRLVVRELTGDMQLTRAEADAAHVLVTTPEKWDVVTRKAGNHDNALGNQCGLLIIDEVHLLADERGAVIESVVARLHRSVESRQTQTRIVGLSATLPNYQDVAQFLQVPERGTFFFGPEHRPVPLQQTFVGVSVPTRDRAAKEQKMNDMCYDVVTDALRRGYQCMVFVHSRKGTGDTANALADLAMVEGVLEQLFLTIGKEGPPGEANKRYADRVKKSRNREVGIHFDHGMGIHHAGMLRGDRKLTEQMFNDGAIKVLCCTATLAWGVNLPAHTVVIKGTEVYNPEKGGNVDLSSLDVQQIFGRAGRPQFDTSGEATLITTSEAFPRYMDKMVRAVAIESNFIKQLADHLNAEVVGGTVTNLREAATWLRYSYLYTRMLRNPLAYGISADEKADDPSLGKRCTELVTDAAKVLDSIGMVLFDQRSGNLSVRSDGRIAAHFYIQAESVATFNDMMRRDSLGKADLLRIIASAQEFQSMKVRQEELSELASLHSSVCPMSITGAGRDDTGHALITGPEDKAFVLMQAYISRSKTRSFTLVSDMNFIAANAGRVARAIFEMCLNQNKARAAKDLLQIANSIDYQIWWFQTPLRHFVGELKDANYSAIENLHSGPRGDAYATALSLLDMQPKEVGDLSRWHKGGGQIQKLVKMLPTVEVEWTVHPLTASVARFHVEVTPTFNWSGRWHGGAQSFWLWIADYTNERIYHHERIIFSRKRFPEPVVLELLIPIFGSTEQYFITVMSDSWVAIDITTLVSLRDVKMPKNKTLFTEVQDLMPLPVSALQEPVFESIYQKIGFFNPIQTQMFHTLYHTNVSVFVGAPTGSGKTIIAELALLHMKQVQPDAICVYIAPLKSLARERLKEWQRRFGAIGWQVLELSGDTHHDQFVLDRADILVCTPEKYDLISRGWRGVRDAVSGEMKASNSKSFIKRVKLLVLDEIHLVGEERGAVLEAIVSRTRFIARVVKDEKKKSSKDGQDPLSETRIVGLSTALENPLDLADWIGIETKAGNPLSRRGLYNFKSTVRPVPMTVHVQGYSGRHYCPRMATMNKPIFHAIKELSPEKPSLIFVASRRQTRLTAFDIINYAAAEEDAKRFLKCSEEYVESVAERIADEALRHTILFGIGLHHAGLSSQDRDTVESMYLSGEIQVLVATATLAWGVNLPAHLVIVKGTEFFDAKVSRYVDYPLTDVLQMIGRAGRPGFDTRGVAVVMSTEDMMPFYKKFLLEPFPLESCLRERLCENINAEIASGTISSFVEAVGYLTWTYFARRVKANPSYYGAESSNDEDVEECLLSVAKEALISLRKSGCINYNEQDPDEISAQTLGAACSTYYLVHQTPKQMQMGAREARKMIVKELNEAPPNEKDLLASGSLRPFMRPHRVDEVSCAWILFALCNTHEFNELPVRHNEDILNEELSEQLMWGPDLQSLMSENGQPYRNQEIYASPHTKAFLLVQAHLESARLPISDYVNDTKSVVENLPRLLAAMEYIATDDKTAAGSFELMTQLCRTRQLFQTRTLVDQDPLFQLGLRHDIVRALKNGNKSNKKAVRTISGLRALPRKEASALLTNLNRSNGKGLASMDVALDKLYDIPLVSLVEAKIANEATGGKTVGKLKLTLALHRDKSKHKNGAHQKDVSWTLAVLVGTAQQQMLLATSSVRISRFGHWNVTREVEFDWEQALSYLGGESDGHVLLRLVWDRICGMDYEARVDM